MSNPVIYLSRHEVCTECGNTAVAVVLADENYPNEDPYHGAFAVCATHLNAWSEGDYTPGIS